MSHQVPTAFAFFFTLFFIVFPRRSFPRENQVRQLLAVLLGTTQETLRAEGNRGLMRIPKEWMIASSRALVNIAAAN